MPFLPGLQQVRSRIITRTITMKVTYNGTVLAESDKTEVVEGNHYFPPDSVKSELFSKSSTSSTCPWKGKAAYYNANVGGTTVNDVAWYYPNPSQAASNIKDYVAFYKNKVQFD